MARIENPSRRNRSCQAWRHAASYERGLEFEDGWRIKNPPQDEILPHRLRLGLVKKERC
jgi:hypothetical protein